ncbi:hypothetical protein SUGI_0107820 [Cryptomeria japonica]|nr:hypothetical protein SUGI_0107820 [Cryptomeria japonica]
MEDSDQTRNDGKVLHLSRMRYVHGALLEFMSLAMEWPELYWGQWLGEVSFGSFAWECNPRDFAEHGILVDLIEEVCCTLGEIACWDKRSDKACAFKYAKPSHTAWRCRLLNG